MKYIKLFLEHNSKIQDKVDELLDKVSIHGKSSLSEKELMFLNSQSKDIETTKKAYDDLEGLAISKKIESDDRNFEFELLKITKEDSNSDDGILTTYHGIMTLPTISKDDMKVVKEKLNGDITINEQGIIQTNFFMDDLSDYDLVGELEYEYDNFLIELSIELPNYH